MMRYLNLTGQSNVIGYDIGIDYIKVYFAGSIRPYTYSYASAGRANVETMKRLAHSGSGLNSFINRCVKYSYAR
jgi:hypothetical protein